MGMNVSLQEWIGKVYHHPPIAHTLEETWDQGEFIQKKVWDLSTGNLNFSPIAYREIHTRYKVALEEWLGQENPEWKPLHDTAWGEAYLKPPIFGREARVVVAGEELGRVTELFSHTPNRSAAISLLAYASQLIPTDTKEFIQHIKTVLDEDPDHLLPILLPQLPELDLKQLLHEVTATDHFACIAPPEVQRAILEQLLAENGFAEKCHSFESTVLAKELEAPTKIIKGWGRNKKHQIIGIEFFVPTQAPLYVEEWIHLDRGAHLAFRVKSENSIDLITSILNKNNIEIPPFMQGHAMKNPHEKTIVLYCETQVGNHRFRLEFCHLA